MPNEAKHTPEPWKLAEAVGGRHATGMRRIRSESEGLEHGAVAEVYGINDGTEAAANGARIVACVNACAGINNPAAIPEAMAAFEIITHLVGHNSCSDGRTPNGFAVALDNARAALAHLRQKETSHAHSA